MTTIELNDQFTGEWTSFLETLETYNGEFITDGMCDGIIYKKIDGKYYRRILIGNIVNAKWFGLAGDGIVEDTTKINEAIIKSSKINGTLFFPEGKYIISGNGINLLSNSNLIGVGKDTIFEMTISANWCISVNSGNGGTEYVEDNIKNITIKNLHFKANVEGLPISFSEHKHLMNINAASDVQIEGCYFTQFRGDGIYIGSSNDGGLTERHNERIFIKNCHFDGVNHQNRNGITIVDCSTAVIENCTFQNCTLDKIIPANTIGNEKNIPKMPGAIDIEPDAHEFHIAKNIVIRNNTFKNVGGGPGVISLIINKITTKSGNIIIENNYVTECTNDYSIFVSTSRGAISFDELNDCMVTVRNNIFVGNSSNNNCAFGISSSKNVNFFENKFQNFAKACLISYEDPSHPEEISFVSDVFMERNSFEKLGTSDQSGFYCYNIKNLQFKNNEFKELSKREIGNDFYFYFIRGNSSEIIFERNKFINNEGSVNGYNIVMGIDHTTDENTNVYSNNKDNGMYIWNFHWLRNNAPLSFRNTTPPNGHIFYNETNNISQIYLNGNWKSIQMIP